MTVNANYINIEKITVNDLFHVSEIIVFVESILQKEIGHWVVTVS